MVLPPPVMMANISMADTLILMVLALVVFGPRRLPLIGRQIGKLMYEFRKASNDFKFQMEEELRQAEEADRRKKEEEQRQRVLAAAPPPAQIESPAPPAESPIQPAEPALPAPPQPPAAIGSDVSEPGSVASADPSAQEPVEPSPIASSAQPEPAASLPPEPAPRILPPSTGETVPAARPSPRPEQQELFTSPRDAGESPVSVDLDAPEPETSEPAAHHAADNAHHG
jgi:sec-independent protein translocase protein TatB